MAYAPQLDEAIRLIERQDKAGAQRVLARYLQSTPRDEYAWLWLAYILPNRIQQQQALQQCLKFFPSSPKAQHNLDSIRLGIPLERPSLPPDTPSHAYSSFFGRDLYVPGRGNEPEVHPESPEQSGEESEPGSEFHTLAFMDEPQTGLEPRLVYPTPTVEPITESDWVHEDALNISPLPEYNIPAPIKKTSHSSARASTSRTARKKKKVLKSWQIGCLSLLVLAILALICGGGYFIFSNPPFSDMVNCFQAVLANEFPCPDCSSVAQTCPECQVQATCPSTPIPLPSPTSTSTPLPATATPTASPTPLQPLGPSISLPAPLYFLSEVAGNTQIWKLAQDGSSLTPVTFEKDPVTAFDVSPTDGQLAFISNNSLMLANADGSNRRTLIYGQLLPGIDDPAYWSVLLNSPLWSPDGTQLAFAQDGIQVANLLTNEVKRYEPNQYNGSQPELTRTYSPLAWSPEGTWLAVSVSRASCSNIGFVSTIGGSTIDLNTLPQGYPLWSSDGTSLLIANPLADCACSSGSGLYQVDPITGDSQVILGGLVTANTPSAYVGWPKTMVDGTLLYFFGELPGPACTPNWPGSTLLTMVVGVGEKWEYRMNLRQDRYTIGEALWSADGSLAIIRDQTQDAQARYGPLLILYSDGRPAIELPVEGRSLHWGIPSP